MATSAGDLVDRARFEEVAADCDWSVTELAEFYFEGTARDLERMRAALAARDGAELARLAHGCCGSSGSCGVTGLVAPFQELERLAGAGRFSAAGRQLDSIAARFARVRAELAGGGTDRRG